MLVMGFGLMEIRKIIRKTMKPFFKMKKTRLSESESMSTRQPLAMKGISRVRGSSA